MQAVYVGDGGAVFRVKRIDARARYRRGVQLRGHVDRERQHVGVLVRPDGFVADIGSTYDRDALDRAAENGRLYGSVFDHARRLELCDEVRALLKR